MADVWLDSLSMLVVAPSMSAVAIYAISQTPAAAYAAEASHAAGALLTARSANTFAVGLLGNLFTEELAGRVLLAGSPREARAASFAACGLFGVLGLAPAALGIWARSAPGVLTGEGGESLCAEGGQDRILSAALVYLTGGQKFSWSSREQLREAAVKRHASRGELPLLTPPPPSRS